MTSSCEPSTEVAAVLADSSVLSDMNDLVTLVVSVMKDVCADLAFVVSEINEVWPGFFGPGPDRRKSPIED